jgi:rod shape-determining protein MreD
MKGTSKGIAIIALTLFLGLMFLATPMPPVVSAGRPLLVLLILLYWALYCPDQVGVATAWTVGLLTDFLYGVILGPYALGFALAVYLVVRLNSRFKMFPLFQQSLFMGMLVGGVQLLVIAISIALTHMDMPWHVLWSIPTSLLCWPIVMIILDSARGVFNQAE